MVGVEIFPTEKIQSLTDMLASYHSTESEEKVAPGRSRVLFGDNYPRLQQLKKKYDPELLFSKWFVIEPAE